MPRVSMAAFWVTPSLWMRLLASGARALPALIFVFIWKEPKPTAPLNV